MLLTWQDRRLTLPGAGSRAVIELPEDASNDPIWTPAIDWYNGLSVQEHRKLALVNRSTLVLTRRFSGQFAVRLSFFYFPFDKQVLPIVVEAFHEPRTKVVFSPAHAQMRGGLQNPQWSLDNMTIIEQPSVKITGIEFDRVTAHLLCSRKWNK